MIRRLLLGALVLLASTTALVVSIAIIARFCDGPIAVFPGGRLVEGEKVDYASIDWRDFSNVREIELQLESPPRSRTTRMTIYDGKPYVSCAFCTNRLLKKWPRELEIDDRVVIRVGGKLIEGRAHRVPQDSAEYRLVRDAHLSKFSASEQTINQVESGAATIVVEAGQNSPGHDGATTTDSWMYRIDPR